MKLDLTGIVPATFTPMHEDGEVNLDMIDKYVGFLESENINNAFILGSTGEGCSLSLEERKKFAEKWMTSAKNRVKNTIIHVGAQNLVDTKTLAEHAESIGATAIASIGSFYFKPKGPRHLALYLSEIAKVAPKTPFMYYHIPPITGFSFKMMEFISEIEKIGVPNFAGVKFTSQDLCDLGQCIHNYGKKYSFFYGYDEQLCAGLLLGAQSGVGSTYNYAPKLYTRLYDACKRSDFETAREEQYKCQQFIGYLLSKGLDVGLGKAVMNRVTGIDMGPPRLPMLPTPKSEIDEIMKTLGDMGFFEWVK